MFDIQSTTPGDFPPAPFELHKGRTVTDAALWLTALKRDASRGENGPRHKTGALQEDLKRAEELWICENIRKTREAQSLKNGMEDLNDYF